MIPCNIQDLLLLVREAHQWAKFFTKERKNHHGYETIPITNENTELWIVIKISCNCALFYSYGLWMTLDFYVQAPMATDFLMIKRLKLLLTVFIVFSTKMNETIFV